MKSVLFVLAALAAAPVMAAEHSMHGHNHGGAETQAQTVTANGKVNRIDAGNLTVNLSHGPIPAFNWPPMTMDLKVADADVLEGVSAGDEITFELKKLSAVEYVIVGIEGKGGHSH